MDQFFEGVRSLGFWQWVGLIVLVRMARGFLVNVKNGGE